MFKLTPLSYSFDALEPYIDAATIKIHFNKHHQTYCDNFNEVLKNYPELQRKSAEDILRKLDSIKVKDSDWLKIKNYGGGYVNHNIFWENLNPKNKKNSKLIKEIKKKFGSIKNFKIKFNEIAVAHFGSGWVWLVYDENNKLQLYSLSNQDSPYTLGHTPILTLDIWEHAYYLKYQNKKIDYIKAFWNLIKII